MNNKKIIFLAILWVIVFIIITVIIIWTTWNNNKKNTSIVSNNFKIWILDDSIEDFNLFLEEFKKDSGLSNITVIVESFSDYSEYNKALASAIIKWEAPDLYMLNNNEKSIFLENAIWIDPSIISPDDLRTYFKPFFGDDLIMSVWEEEKTEFVVWVPFGFETMWLYYNFKRVNDVKKLWSFPKLQEVISDFNDNKPWYTALWIWLWTTVENSEDIITQFIMSSWIKNISLLWSAEINSSFSEYFDYASWDNNYIKDHDILSKSSKSNLDYFIDWNISMVFGYPRMLNKIAEVWFSKNFLRVTNFPDFINESETLVNYNYFVLNKNSINKDLAYTFLSYLFSEDWEKSYIENLKHYIPARISVYSELKDNDIHDDFYIKLKHFYNSEAVYSSFNKWIKELYDRDISLIIDSEASYLEKVLSFVWTLKCKSSKIINLENLSTSCE